MDEYHLWKTRHIVLSSAVLLHQQQGESFMDERIFDENLDKDRYFLAYPKSKYCKYCGERLSPISGHCSDCCLEKDAVWNRM